ncbi:MAG: phosphopantetheine-binding protein, partial [Mycobacteriales bacterium]
LEVFHATLLSTRSARPSQQSAEQARKAAQEETELVVDPAFFITLRGRLEGIKSVELLLKCGTSDNELTRYRYDVVLHARATADSDRMELQWGKGALEKLLVALERQPRPAAVRLKGLRDPRLTRDVEQWRAPSGGKAVDPRPADNDTLRPALDAAERLGYRVLRAWSADAGLDGYDLVFVDPHSGPTGAVSSGDLTGRHLINSPTLGRWLADLPLELRGHLAFSLPEHMIPAAYVRLESLPLTPNGKLDRNALPAPDGDAYSHRQYEPPQGEVEQELAERWKELLKVERVGRQDNFFELGGHSLLAVQLVSRIVQGLLRPLSVHQVFQYPTIEGLAQELGRLQRQQVPPIGVADRGGLLELSFAQQRLWFITQLDARAGRA